MPTTLQTNGIQLLSSGVMPTAQQPSKGKYIINFARLERLEIKAPLESDPQQTRFVIIRGERES
jgi:hypothetical protein